jgi:hypothetical protein
MVRPEKPEKGVIFWKIPEKAPIFWKIPEHFPPDFI